jgi:hypothetical protein
MQSKITMTILILIFCRIKVLLASREGNPVLANTTIENTFVR